MVQHGHFKHMLFLTSHASCILTKIAIVAQEHQTTRPTRVSRKPCRHFCWNKATTDRRNHWNHCTHMSIFLMNTILFPKIRVPQNGWFIMEIPIKMDDLGGKPFLETPLWCMCVFEHPCFLHLKFWHQRSHHFSSIGNPKALRSSWMRRPPEMRRMLWWGKRTGCFVVP